MDTSTIELLAPAGSYEALQAAIHAGCDAVYFGVEHLNMRAKSSKYFTVNDLQKIAELCHKNKVKCYLTLNTILYDRDLELMKNIVNTAKESKIDAIIASDMAVVLYAREKNVEVHISTQMSLSNVQAVRFYAQYADRVVLARELTLKMISKIYETIKKESIKGPKGSLVELEAFAHGAMCVAVSGRCGMSLYTDFVSANRGACRQICRRAFKVMDKDTGKSLIINNEYVMSPEDLCTIGFLDQMIDTGIKVLKIEGRGRSPEYVDTVVSTYRAALTSIDEGTFTKEKVEKWNKDLGTVFNRGLSEGFYMGKPVEKWSGVYGSKATKEKQYVGVIKHFYPKISVAELLIESNPLSIEDDYSINGITTGVVRGNVKTMLLDDKDLKIAKKGQLVTFKVPKKVRAKDKLYIIKDTKKRNDQ